MTTAPAAYFKSARLITVLLSIGALVVFKVANGQLTVREIVTPGLGTIIGGPSGRQFTLNTDGTVTGADAADHLFGSVSGVVLLQKQQPPAPINIVAENVTTNGGLTVNAIPCAWHNQPQTTCNGPGINVTAVGRRRLQLGVDITTSQTHAGGDTASISFDITVTFL